MKLSERLRKQSWIRFSDDAFRTLDLSDDVLAEIEQLEKDAAAFAETAAELQRVLAERNAEWDRANIAEKALSDFWADCWACPSLPLTDDKPSAETVKEGIRVLLDRARKALEGK